MDYIFVKRCRFCFRSCSVWIQLNNSCKQLILSNPDTRKTFTFITARIGSMTGRYCFHRCLSVNISGRGGNRSSLGWGGYPNLGWGGYPKLGLGVPGPKLGWGVPGLRSGGGTPSQVWGGSPGTPHSKGKNYWHQIWLDTCSDWKKKFCRGTSPPPRKGENFWHQIWLDTCSDWEKKFSQRDPPPQ